MMHLFKNERNVILLGMFSLYTVLSLSQTPLDPCFMSATPSTGFASSANLLNVASSDLISWNGAGWTGSWPGANLTIPPVSGNIGCRAVFIGSGTAWTTGGEGFGIRLSAPLLAGQTYSYNITSVSHGTGSTGSFTPQVFSNTTGTMAGAVAMPNLPAAGTSWTTNTYTFTATAAQAGHTVLIIRTSTVAPTISTGLISSFCTVNCSVALPVEFIDFDYACVDNQPLLQWNVASETDNDYFTIARSEDGTHFTDVAKIQGAGTSLEKKTYSWLAETHAPGETAYYQVSQTDFDGRVSEFKVISVNSCLSATTTASFANNGLNIRGEAIEALELYDGTGKLIHSATYTKETNEVIRISSEVLSAGVYHLIVHHRDQTVERIKCIKY